MRKVGRKEGKKREGGRKEKRKEGKVRKELNFYAFFFRNLLEDVFHQNDKCLIN